MRISSKKIGEQVDEDELGGPMYSLYKTYIQLMREKKCNHLKHISEL